jgi:hypothetical protein
MNIFKEAFKIHRDDKQIFRGFELEHRSDVTKIYVSPLNQGNGQTFIAQAIGEGLNLALDIIDNKKANKDGNTVLTIKNSLETLYAYSEIYPSDVWYEQKIISDEISSFKVSIETTEDGAFDGNEEYIINIGAYDVNGEVIAEDDADFLSYEYFVILICVFSLIDWYLNSIKALSADKAINNYFGNPDSKESFVKEAEDMYQKYKVHSYEIEYEDVMMEVPSMLTEDVFESFTEANKEKIIVDKYIDIQVKQFDCSEFLAEYLPYIPRLTEELTLDKDLIPIASAIKSGDCISYL